MREAEIRTVEDVAAEALRLFVGCMREATERRGRFVVSLAGGSTPLPVYRALSGRRDLPWDRCWVAWGDERFVPHDDGRSNYRAAREAFLDTVPVPATQVLPWPYRAGLSPEDAAASYAATLAAAFGDPPEFDLTLLGLGDDAHTASLFPGTGAATRTGIAIAVRPPDQPEPRLSLTAAALSRSRTVAFLVRGEDKRPALEATLAGAGELDRYPARGVSARERLLVLTDLEVARSSAG